MTKREIMAILRESGFAPGKAGPMKVVADVGNPEYYVRRSVELCVGALQDGDFDGNLKQAISLLALARLTFQKTCNEEHQGT